MSSTAGDRREIGPAYISTHPPRNKTRAKIRPRFLFFFFSFNGLQHTLADGSFVRQGSFRWEILALGPRRILSCSSNPIACHCEAVGFALSKQHFLQPRTLVESRDGLACQSCFVSVSIRSGQNKRCFGMSPSGVC